MRHSEWCWGLADLPQMYIPESPVLEWFEERLIEIDRHFPDAKLSENEELSLMLYDDLVRSVRPGSVCSRCWAEDQKLYDKYYDPDDDVDSRFGADDWA